MHDILKFILHPISDSAEDGIRAQCGDGVVRRCYIRVAAWLADFMEICTIHSVYEMQCRICECPTDQLGRHGQACSRWDHDTYEQWVKADDVEQLKTAAVKLVSNAMWILRDL